MSPMKLPLLLLLCWYPRAMAWTSSASILRSGQCSNAAGAAVPAASRVVMQRRGRGRGRGPPPVVDKTPINDAIQFETMRVMVDAGGGADEMLGIMSKEEALKEAEERELDLVLIADKSDPPVVKIVSYDKFRFAKEKKRKEQQKAAARGKSELKELKLSYKIGDHDFEVRKKNAIKFLSAGDKVCTAVPSHHVDQTMLTCELCIQPVSQVKFSMLFRGREVTHADVGEKIMLRMASDLEELGVLDSPPKVMGRQMIMMVSPRPAKK